MAGLHKVRVVNCDTGEEFVDWVEPVRGCITSPEIPPDWRRVEIEVTPPPTEQMT